MAMQIFLGKTVTPRLTVVSFLGFEFDHSTTKIGFVIYFSASFYGQCSMKFWRERRNLNRLLDFWNILVLDLSRIFSSSTNVDETLIDRKTRHKISARKLVWKAQLEPLKSKSFAFKYETPRFFNSQLRVFVVLLFSDCTADGMVGFWGQNSKNKMYTNTQKY